MQLIKLVYFAHGWHLAFYDQGLIRERVEAWEYGPVIPSLYHIFKRFGTSEITQDDYYLSDRGIDLGDTRTLAFLNKAWEQYGHLSGGQLSALTHIKEAPWNIVTTRKKEEMGFIPNHLEIPNREIKKYFLNLRARNRKELKRVKA